MGRAVYDSGLPTNIGVKLYDELSKAEAGLVLGEPLHLMYIIMQEHPFTIFGWSYWGKLFGSLPSLQKKVITKNETNTIFALRHGDLFFPNPSHVCGLHLVLVPTSS